MFGNVNGYLADLLGGADHYCFVFRAKLASRKTKVGSFYFDLNWLMKCWAVDGTPRA